MIKKTIVGLELAVALILGALIVGQIGISPEKARQSNHRAPLWYVNPWWSDTTQATVEGAAQTPPAQPSEARSKRSRDIRVRQAILAPSAALDAMIANLENKDLEPAGSALIPAQSVQCQPEVQKKAKPAPAARKKATPAAPLRVTTLQVVPEANGVAVKGLTSAPVERMDLYTYASPPRMILELYGTFDPYTQTITVPPNPIIQSVTTEITANKLRIIGTLLTDKAVVAPVSRASSRDAFAVELTIGAGAQAGSPPNH
jgi:hypothetical protein